jgi:hypothetical protein
MEDYAMNMKPKRNSVRLTALSSFAVAIFALALGLAGQTPSQAATCDCVPVVSECGAGKTCKFGGCTAPGGSSSVIGRCASTGGGGKLDPADDFTSERGPGEALTKKHRKLQQP